MAEVDATLKRHDLAAAADHLAALEAIAVHAPPAQRAEHALSILHISEPTRLLRS